ncbi:MAG: LemA family protein [Candidatus Diapherotrites archaeon]
MWEWAIVAVILVIIAIIVVLFNSLIVTRNRVRGAWAQIDVQLKRRSDLVPNLVETVKGYAKHEKGIFSQLAQARQAMSNATSVKEKAMASDIMSRTLKSLIAIAESNPQLRASENFQSLQQELSDIEGKIAFSRQFYNDNVLAYNNAIQTVPGSLIAGPLGFKEQEYFEVSEGERTAPKVQF